MVRWFVERLSDLTADEWLSAGRWARRAKADRAPAIARLEALAELAAGLDWWMVSDDIATAAAYCFAEQRYTDVASYAAEAAKVAALSLWMRPLISEADFEVLYRPFMALIQAEGAAVITQSS